MEDEVGRLEKGCKTWAVKNYSALKRQLRVGNFIESDEFMAGGHRWAIELYPNGHWLDIYDQGYASIYLALKSNCIKAVQILYDLHVMGVDHQSMGISHFKTHEGIPCPRGGDRCGSPFFIKRAALAKYLKDDCLTIRCTVGVLACPIPNHPLLLLPGNGHVDYDEFRYLKRICSSLFQKLVCRCTTTRQQVTKILSFAKGSSYQKLEKKEN